MKCCQCQGIESQFDTKLAAKELNSYRRRGPRKSTRICKQPRKRPSGEAMVTA